jgi:hypothetical protein
MLREFHYRLLIRCTFIMRYESVFIVTSYGYDDRGVWFSAGVNLLSLYSPQARSTYPPQQWVLGDSFPGGKRPKREPHNSSLKFFQLNWTILLWDVIPDRKNWVNCAVLIGNSAGLQNCPFQSSFTQRTAQFTQGIPRSPQFTCRHHDGIISRHNPFQQFIQQMSIAWYIPFRIPLLSPHFTFSFLLFG